MEPTDVVLRSQLGRLDYMAAGGQAKVYAVAGLRLPDCPSALVYKEYKPGQVPLAGLEAIVSFRRKLSTKDRAAIDAIAAWPARLVKDGSATTGIVMPRIPDGFFHTRPSGDGGRTKAREAQFLFISPRKCKRLGFPRVNLFQRFAVCRELAAALSFLHEHGVVFGDLNAKNELFRLHSGDDDASVMLVDCDAVRIVGSAAVVRQLNSPDWFPPKGETNLTKATDVYKLGLFIVRVLSPGDNASTASDPARVDALLDGPGRDLLRRTLGSDRNQRPTTDDWRQYFADRPTGARSVVPAKPASRVTGSGDVSGNGRGTTGSQTTGWVRNAQGKWVRPS